MGGCAVIQVGATRFPAAWLDLREPADAAARAVALLDPLRAHVTAYAGIEPIRVWDLGSGTGAMARWLAPRLPRRQHWVLHDRDPELLGRAASHDAPVDADGRPVTVATRLRDVTAVTAGDLSGVCLVTASALLDLLTADEVDQLVGACVEAGSAVLFTLSVTGEVHVSPADPLDEEIRVAFNEHQRRIVGGRRLLGPDAIAAAVAAFRRRGARVYQQASPWRLGEGTSELLAQWLRGWVGAAREQRPELSLVADDYLRRRLAAATAGALRATVGHRDLLVLPDQKGR